ncbi:MAG: pyrroline-5-carboxylate reductase, partial [Eggerthellaceae bacterium]|nr:pyrroline-5-carboxylate reductase [Eggerthellaceae bacterium]
AGKRFVIVGGGKMGGAILKGWIASKTAPADAIEPSDVIVVDPGEERRAFIGKTYGVKCISDVSDVTEAPDVVVLAVKPQVMMAMLETLAVAAPFGGGEKGPLFISIAAGLTTDSLEAALPAGAPLVRVMPNVALAIGAGASGVCAGSKATSEQVRYVADLVGCLGRAVIVEEADMDAVCALSGSGPAYVAAMIEALRDAAAAEGLDAELAETLALQTVLGTARLIDETGESVAETRVSVCSPGGTTLAALDAMNAAGFAGVFEAGVKAAVARSKELAQ